MLLFSLECEDNIFNPLFYKRNLTFSTSIWDLLEIIKNKTVISSCLSSSWWEVFEVALSFWVLGERAEAREPETHQSSLVVECEDGCPLVAVLLVHLVEVVFA